MRLLKIAGSGLVILIFLLLSAANDVEAEQMQSTVKSELNEDGKFICRLRLDNNFIRFSLSGSMDSGKIGYIEPYFRGPLFSIGRLNLKGTVREYCSNGSPAPSSPVFSEPSGISSTDSFSGSSRYGFFFELNGPFIPDSDILFWGYKKNTEEVSSGVLFGGLPVIKLTFLDITTDLIVTAAEYPETRLTGSWFSAGDILPRQAGINGAAELKGIIHPFLCLPDASAWKSFYLAASLLGGYSLPQYTETGWILRVFFKAGTEMITIFSLFQHSEKSFLSPEGAPSGYGDKAGAGIEIQPDLEGADLVCRAEYSNKLDHELTVPSRYLEQTEDITASVKFDTETFTGSLRGSSKMLQKANGAKEEDASGNIELKIARGHFSMAASAGYAAAGVFEYGSGFILTPNTGCFAEGFNFSAGLSLGCSRKVDSVSTEDDVYELGIDFNFAVQNGDIKVKLGFDSSSTSPALSVGFEQIIRNW